MKAFLTTAPDFKRIRPGEWDELAVLSYESIVGVTGVIKCYRKAGTTASYTQAVSISGGRAYFVMTVPGAETFALLSKIEFWLEMSNGITNERVTDIRTYLPDNTARKTPIRVGWLNTLGGIDNYTFTGLKTSEAAVTRTEYLKDLPANFTIQDRTSAVLSTIFKEEIEVVSDFETEAVYRWLATIMLSPEVWINDGGVIIPVNVSSTSQTIVTDKLVQARLKFHKSNDIIGQNG